MKTIIGKPIAFTADLIEQMISFVDEGEQVNRRYVELGVENADLIAMIIDDNTVVTAATLKNPIDSYRESVFRQAGVENEKDKFSKELGYVVSNPTFEGKKFCQKLLSEFLPSINNQNIFATTRKPAMSHILAKNGFKKTGNTYKEDLNLLTFKP